MFSIMSSEERDRTRFTVAIVVGTLLLAFLLSATAVFQVFYEYRMLSGWLERPEPVGIAEGSSGSVRAEIRRDLLWRICLSPGGLR